MIRSLLTAFLLLALLSACGFKLRGDSPLPLQMAKTHLEIPDPGGEFARGFRRQLERSGVALVAKNQSDATLEFLSNRVDQDILSIGANSRVREYNLRMSVSFRLLDSAGEELIPLQSLELSRPLSFDETEILASNREQEFVRNELASSMIRQVMSRLSQLNPAVRIP